MENLKKTEENSSLLKAIKVLVANGDTRLLKFMLENNKEVLSEVKSPELQDLLAAHLEEPAKLSKGAPLKVRAVKEVEDTKTKNSRKNDGRSL